MWKQQRLLHNCLPQSWLQPQSKISSALQEIWSEAVRLCPGHVSVTGAGEMRLFCPELLAVLAGEPRVVHTANAVRAQLASAAWGYWTLPWRQNTLEGVNKDQPLVFSSQNRIIDLFTLEQTPMILKSNFLCPSYPLNKIVKCHIYSFFLNTSEYSDSTTSPGGCSNALSLFQWKTLT